ncbi:MAG: FAD/NAD(P)-binding protein, partial [Verrucomicrobiaceae bacterium]
MDFVDVAIIGAGFSGTLLAIHLLEAEAGPPLTVALIERRGEFGKGVAYGTSCWRHLLNVPAAKMSAFPDQPDHFLE